MYSELDWDEIELRATNNYGDYTTREDARFNIESAIRDIAEDFILQNRDEIGRLASEMI